MQSRKLMNRLLIAGLMVVGGICHGEIRHAQNGSGDPLSRLTHQQRAHYNVYAMESEAMAKEEKIDRKKLFADMFVPVVHWCRENADKYLAESARMNEKAAQLTNERAKREALANAVIYKDLYDNCQKILKAFDEHKKAGVVSAMKGYVDAEHRAVENKLQVIRREWLTYEEARRFMAVAEKGKGVRRPPQNAPANGGQRVQMQRVTPNPAPNRPVQPQRSNGKKKKNR